MKNYFLLILLFCSFASYGQLRYDSLERICIEQFCNDKYKYPDNECNGCKVAVKKEYDDTFGRYIILGVYDLDTLDIDYDKLRALSPYLDSTHFAPENRYVLSFNTEYLVYMIDIYTGKIVSVDNYETFNKIMNSSKQKVYKVEKWTLFLLLNHKGCYGLSDLLYGYPTSIRQSDAFLSLQLTFGHERRSEIKKPDWLCSKIQYDIDHSDNKNIVVYEFLSDTNKYLACRYQFLFDSTDNISSINKEYLK